MQSPGDPDLVRTCSILQFQKCLSPHHPLAETCCCCEPRANPIAAAGLAMQCIDADVHEMCL